MPGRSYTAGTGYRYGFNGQEKVDEIEGENNFIEFKYRMHDPKLARFISIDPLNKQFPWNSTYSFAENTPIIGKELEGREIQVSNTGKIYSGPFDIKAVNANNIRNEQYKVVDFIAKTTKYVKDQTFLEFSATSEARLGVNWKSKVLGIGLEGKIGQAQPLTSFKLNTSEGIITSAGGSSVIDGGVAIGPLGVSASKNVSDANAELKFNIATYEQKINLESSESRITIFNFGASFLAGANFSLTMDAAVLNPKPPTQSNLTLKEICVPDETTIIIKTPENNPFKVKPRKK